MYIIPSGHVCEPIGNFHYVMWKMKKIMKVIHESHECFKENLTGQDIGSLVIRGKGLQNTK